MKPKTIWITRDDPDADYEMWGAKPLWNAGVWTTAGPCGRESETMFELLYPASWHLAGGEDSIIEVELHG